MIRTTITLPEDLARLLTREARQRDTSVSDVVRQALALFLGVTGRERRDLPFAALGRSGRRRTSRDAEKILAAEWADARRR